MRLPRRDGVIQLSFQVNMRKGKSGDLYPGTMNERAPATIVCPLSTQTVWQSSTDGLAIPSCTRIAHRTTLRSPSRVLSLPRAARAVAPFYHKDMASLAVGVGSCNHQLLGDEVFEVE